MSLLKLQLGNGSHIKNIWYVLVIFMFKTYFNTNIAGHITPVSKITMISLPSFVLSLFTGRQKYFLKLQKYFISREKPWKRRSFLLYGTGGIGKSQIALRFALNEQQSK